MFKTIDEIMYITDGINPLGQGIGFKPTQYNIKGSGYLEDIDTKIKQLEPFVKSTGKGKELLSELFKIKYGTIKRMKGKGTFKINEDNNKLTGFELTDIDNIDNLTFEDIEEKIKENEEFLRYLGNKEKKHNPFDEDLTHLDEYNIEKKVEQDINILKNQKMKYEMINQLDKDEKKLNKDNEKLKEDMDVFNNLKNNMDNLKKKAKEEENKKKAVNKKTNAKKDEDSFFKSDEFKEQMKWYEENYDNLDEGEMFNYMESLAKLKEIEYKNKGISKEFTELDIKLYKVAKDFKDLYGDNVYYYEDEYLEKKINKWYIPNIEPDDYENNLYIELEKLGYNYIEIGNLCEKYYSDRQELFKFINKNDDSSIIINTSNTSHDYYTDKMKIKGEEKIILDNKWAKISDAFLVDFISENNLYEMKSLSKSFRDYYDKGSIHLVGSKISENKNFKARFIYDKSNDKVVVENIGYRGSFKKPIEFDTLKGNNYNYNAIFCLKDGIYYCDLGNPKLWIIDKNNNAIFKYPKDVNGNVHIPINFLQRIDNNLVDKLNK